MIQIITHKKVTSLLVEVGKFKKIYPLPTDTQDFEQTLTKVHDLHAELIATQQPTLVDVLFKCGTPQYIHLTKAGSAWMFQLQLTSNPMTGESFTKPITASASVAKFGLERSFEVVWSKLANKLNLLEDSLVYPLKCAALAHYRQQYLFRK